MDSNCCLLGFRDVKLPLSPHLQIAHTTLSMLSPYLLVHSETLHGANFPSCSALPALATLSLPSDFQQKEVFYHYLS